MHTHTRTREGESAKSVHYRYRRTVTAATVCVCSLDLRSLVRIPRINSSNRNMETKTLAFFVGTPFLICTRLIPGFVPDSCRFVDFLQQETAQETAAAACVENHISCTMVKVLLAGDVKGSVSQLLAKVAQYHK